jgi:putative salt-induced outer membrane protein
MLPTLLLYPLLVLAASQPSDRQIADDILERERAVTRAMHTRDRAGLEALLADDYVLRSVPDIPRETWITNAVTLCWGDRSDISDFDVRALEGTAVATFALTFYVDPATCRPAVLRSLITDVWRWRDGRWQLAVRHSGPPPAGPGIAAQYGIVPELPPVWDAKGELSFLSTAGNASTRTIGLASDVAHQTGRWRTRARVALLTSEADDVIRARTLTASARQSARVSARAEVFGRLDYARDRFAGIENRATLEFGAAFPITLPPRHRLTADAGVGFTTERRIDAEDLRFAVASGTFAYVWQIAPGTELRDDIAIRADLEAARNWRATNALAMTVVLNRLLSIKASQSIEYRHFPVPGFRRTDTRSAISLVVNVQRRPGQPGSSGATGRSGDGR